MIIVRVPLQKQITNSRVMLTFDDKALASIYCIFKRISTFFGAFRQQSHYICHYMVYVCIHFLYVYLLLKPGGNKGENNSSVSQHTPKLDVAV